MHLAFLRQAPNKPSLSERFFKVQMDDKLEKFGAPFMAEWLRVSIETHKISQFLKTVTYKRFCSFMRDSN